MHVCLSWFGLDPNPSTTLFLVYVGRCCDLDLVRVVVPCSLRKLLLIRLYKHQIFLRFLHPLMQWIRFKCRHKWINLILYGTFSVLKMKKIQFSDERYLNKTKWNKVPINHRNNTHQTILKQQKWYACTYLGLEINLNAKCKTPICFDLCS